jgi:hypothetical protein
MKSNILYLDENISTIKQAFYLAFLVNYDFFCFENKIYKVNDSSFKYTNFYFENGIIKTDTNSRFPDFIDLSLIGREIIKKSKKPFKSGEKIGVVTGFSYNNDDPKSRLALIVDNESLVNINICKLNIKENI